MKRTFRKIASFTFRWGIAVVGIWWVLANMSILDHALELTEGGIPARVVVQEQISADTYRISQNGASREVSGRDLINPPDRSRVRLADGREVYLRGMDLVGDTSSVDRLLVSDTDDGPARWISPQELQEPFHVRVPHPKVEVGLKRMVVDADPWLIVLSVGIFPITIILTSIRWRRLLQLLDIHLPHAKTLALNWVGLFYNTFIPMGSMGGDLLKAYYASTHTTHKARAVMSVAIDRIIGLVVLIILGGAMAGANYLLAENKMSPAVRACGHVAVMAILLLGAMTLFLVVAYSQKLRAVSGFEKLLARLPMQKHVQSAIEVMAIYRQQPKLVLWAMIVTVPVHVTVIVSAMLAGKAFGLPLSSGYYFVVVPVTVLVGSIPISPQGAGVMEFFAINLTARQGATVSQAFALTMSLRVVQILWNLVGGIFVITGHYRAPQTDGLPETENTPA